MRGGPDYEREFTTLMQAYAGPVRRLCSVYSENTVDREDLFQEIWSSPVFLGVTLIGVWQFTSGASSAALLVWAIAATGWAGAAWATQSTFVRLRERQSHLEQLLADLQ